MSSALQLYSPFEVTAFHFTVDIPRSMLEILIWSGSTPPPMLLAVSLEIDSVLLFPSPISLALSIIPAHPTMLAETIKIERTLWNFFISRFQLMQFLIAVELLLAL
jgi:hypothetical protein